MRVVKFFMIVLCLGLTVRASDLPQNSLIQSAIQKSTKGIESSNLLKIATWNIRQGSEFKMQKKISVSGVPQNIGEFVGKWFKARSVDILAMQEFQERKNLTLNTAESPLATLKSYFPKYIDVLLGEPVREPTLRGLSSQWSDYCPIFFNTQKLNCRTSKENQIQIGYDYDVNPSANPETTKTPRYVNWAYCESKNKKFDFVISCVHTNYKTAENHVKGMQNVIKKIVQREVAYPLRFEEKNLDFVFAGDFNIDRRSSRVFRTWSSEGLNLDDTLPLFPQKTRWNKSSFTKLKDVYSFTEARKKSKDIYDDVAHTTSMSESLVSKFVDPLIDEFFINPSNNRVDMNSLLNLSDHLPVISTFDLSKDTD